MAALRIVVVGAFLLLASCSQGGVDEGTSNLSVDQRTYSASSSSGRRTVSFEVPDGTTAFQITALADGGNIQLISLQNPLGQSIREGSSDAGNPGPRPSPYTVNFPYLDAAVLPGTYQATFSLSGVSELRAVVTSKKDSNKESGVLRVNVISTGTVAGSDDAQSSIGDAIEAWQSLYDKAGIKLDVERYSFDGPETLPDPRTGNGYYSLLLSQVRGDSLNIVIGTRVEGTRGEYYFGIPGSRPGSIVYAPQSVIALSVLAMTGNDGQFNYTGFNYTQVVDDEIRLLAEEMARLAAAYLGLESIVTLQGNRVVASDSLADTETCVSFTDCRADGDVRNNLMFPFPIQEPSGSFIGSGIYYVRNTLTTQQSQVLNNNVMVD